ncbi:hypothetical protein FDP41_012395 [Naegleria fowleri]|uniref:Uncharacterized protein n=1 Tax=Naegleria fowleri TaxID=5763 RepID=A0A6A5C7M0_NAEFO|nr:uncharacterized protein FDP41_012395 [Naegleria fowleri]KAF0981738.1 hypothetical protein FDP41_012395 [Naegleria fowleri]CAG4717676.1 unnamed protein product [Naegleria fowleri]
MKSQQQHSSFSMLTTTLLITVFVCFFFFKSEAVAALSWFKFNDDDDSNYHLERIHTKYPNEENGIQHLFKTNASLEYTNNNNNNLSIIDWQRVDPLYGSPCNSTIQCGKHLLCINSTCQSCDLAREGELCIDDPYVVCRVQNRSVKLIGNHSNHVTIAFGLCGPKNLFPITIWDLMGSFFSSFGGIAAAASGVGGGGV